MADTTTSGEAAAGALTGAELVRIVQGAGNKKLDLSTLATFIASVITLGGGVRAVTGTSDTIVTADRAKLVTYSNAGAIAVTLPQSGSAGFPNTWYTFLLNLGAGTVTVTPTTSTINGAATLTLAQNQGAIVFSDGTNYEAIKVGAGTAFTGGTLTSALNEAPTVTLASAATVNIGAAAANTILISGTTTITAFDTIAAGAMRRLRFGGALTLTYNATSLILPTSANITTAADDVAEFLSLGSGNWFCTSYSRKNGQALSGSSFTGGTLSSALNEAPPVTLASASTVNIGAAAANTVNISGTTTITAFDTIAAGAKRMLVFAGALTLTHNATSLILPTAANITTAAGDVADFESLGSGNWKCVGYQKANGQALAGGASGTVHGCIVRRASAFSFTANTAVKINFDTEELDPSNEFDNATNFVFTPTVAGWYQVSVQICVSGSPSFTLAGVMKNGSAYRYGTGVGSGSSRASISVAVYCNGSTDNIAGFVYSNSTSLDTGAGALDNWMTIVKVA